jgi:hypothetical protein
MSKEEELQALACDYKTVFKSDAGIATLKDLARFCGEGQNPYVEGSFDKTAQKTGKLAVILYIRKMLSSDGELRQTDTTTERTEQ